MDQQRQHKPQPSSMSQRSDAPTPVTSSTHSFQQSVTSSPHCFQHTVTSSTECFQQPVTSSTQCFQQSMTSSTQHSGQPTQGAMTAAKNPQLSAQKLQHSADSPQHHATSTQAAQHFKQPAPDPQHPKRNEQDRHKGNPKAQQSVGASNLQQSQLSASHTQQSQQISVSNPHQAPRPGSGSETQAAENPQQAESSASNPQAPQQPPSSNPQAPQQPPPSNPQLPEQPLPSNPQLPQQPPPSNPQAPAAKGQQQQQQPGQKARQSKHRRKASRSKNSSQSPPPASTPTPPSMQPAQSLASTLEFWHERIRAWYPNLLTQSYFLPSVHMNRVQYRTVSVSGEDVMVADVPDASELKRGDRTTLRESDVREDQALMLVLRCLQDIAGVGHIVDYISTAPETLSEAISARDERHKEWLRFQESSSSACDPTSQALQPEASPSVSGSSQKLRPEAAPSSFEGDPSQQLPSEESPGTSSGSSFAYQQQQRSEESPGTSSMSGDVPQLQQGIDVASSSSGNSAAVDSQSSDAGRQSEKEIKGKVQSIRKPIKNVTARFNRKEFLKTMKVTERLAKNVIFIEINGERNLFTIDESEQKIDEQQPTEVEMTQEPKQKEQLQQEKFPKQSRQQKKNRKKQLEDQKKQEEQPQLQPDPKQQHQELHQQQQHKQQEKQEEQQHHEQQQQQHYEQQQQHLQQQQPTYPGDSSGQTPESSHMPEQSCSSADPKTEPGSSSPDSKTESTNRSPDSKTERSNSSPCPKTERSNSSLDSKTERSNSSPDSRTDGATEASRIQQAEVAQHEKEAMFVVSQLRFDKYLNKVHGDGAGGEGSGCRPAVGSSDLGLPRPADLKIRGEFDLLIFHLLYGILVCEIKAVGEKLGDKTEAQREAIVRKRVQGAVTQLQKEATVLEHVLSDLQTRPRILKSILLPHLSASELRRVLAGDPDLKQNLCACLGTEEGEDPVTLCLTSDDLHRHRGSPRRWWQQRMTLAGPDPCMTPDIYRELVARFGGPATTVDVFCPSLPRLGRRSDLELRTEQEAVLATSRCFSQLVLHPQQLSILHKDSPKVFLTGPPGTGKTLLLVLKGLAWLRDGKQVHVVSTWHESLSATYMIMQQLLETEPAAHDRIHLHEFNLWEQERGWQRAVSILMDHVEDDSLHILSDEIGPDSTDPNRRIDAFCRDLSSKVPNLRLWAASMFFADAPPTLTVYTLTEHLRMPPTVAREVQLCDTMGPRGSVLAYSVPKVPLPCEGLPPKEMYHVPDHGADTATYCFQCGRELALLLKNKLRVGQAVTEDGTMTSEENRLRYKDVVLLIRHGDVKKIVSPDMTEPIKQGLVAGLEAEGVPCQTMLLKEGHRGVATMACEDKVLITWFGPLMGLERKVVVWSRYDKMGEEWGRLLAMSRCTGQLVIIKKRF